MITVTYRVNGVLKTAAWADAVDTIPTEQVVWIDLLQPTEEEKNAVQKVMDFSFPTRQELEEIESSARYFETETIITTNSNFLLQDPESGFFNEPVSFHLKNHTLITYRHVSLRSFDETYKKLDANNRAAFDGFHIFILIFDARVDLDADLIESIARDISAISKQITVERELDSDLILKITQYQETTMLLRQNIIDKQRVLSSVLRSDYFPKDHIEKIRILLKDIGSLLDHTSFSFDRLEYLQNTFLGLVDLEQNKIIKLFSVVTIIFMPPTLIASIYGMNFKNMPEIGWPLGYPMAIGLMLLSMLGTVMYFRARKWL